MTIIEPGTYIITSVASGTVMTVPKDNGWTVVGWERHNGRNQQWFVQRSGDGYRIKNCEGGYYLTASSPNARTQVYCGRYPITWELVQGHDDYNMHIIRYGDSNGVIDLADWGAAHNGNELHIQPRDGWLACKRWRFERLSDDTGEDEQNLKRELSLVKESLVEKDQVIRTREQELTQIRLDLSEKSSQLAQIQDSLCQANELLASREIEILRIQMEKISERLETELTQQKEETARLSAKIERFESLLSEKQDEKQESHKKNNMV